MVFETPLDLRTILVNYFAGSMTIFYALAVIVFAYLAARFRMPNYIFLVMMVLFITTMAGLGYPILYALVIVIGGMIAFWIMAKTIKT